MKKLLFILISLIFSYISFSQTGEGELSNYEKYKLAKEKAMVPDTVYKNDTLYVDAKEESPEYDDIYYRAKKDDLKLKQKELRLEKKELRLEQQAAYYDAKQEVYNDLYYSSLIYRFHRGYTFTPYDSYRYGYYDPFFYDSWYWDSWYWSPSYYYGYYPYRSHYWYGYPYYNYRYDWNWKYWDRPKYYIHNEYNYYGYNCNTGFPKYPINNNSITYRRGESSSTLSKTPVTVNRTVEVDRRSGRVLGTRIEGQRRISTSTNQPVRTTSAGVREQEVRRESTTTTRTNTQATRVLDPSTKPTYREVERTYTPTYEKPRMQVRPQYNNTDINRRSTTNTGNEVRTSTQTRTQTRSTYSTPPANTNRTIQTTRPSTSSRPTSGSSSSSRSSSSGGRR